MTANCAGGHATDRHVPARARVIGAMRFAVTIVAAGLVAMSLAVAGCGSADDRGGSQRAVVRSADSSWVPGQISMAELAAFQTISGPALALAQERAQQRKRELALLEARRIAARKKAREDAQRKYREALRRAREKYRLALKKAAEERKKALEKQARLKREYDRKRREAEEKRKVKPGEECADPSVRSRYRCSTGKTPLPETAPKR